MDWVRRSNPGEARGPASTLPQGSPQGGGQVSANSPQGGGQASANSPQGGGQASANSPQGGGQASVNSPQGGGQASVNSPQGGGQASANSPQSGGQASANSQNSNREGSQQMLPDHVVMTLLRREMRLAYACNHAWTLNDVQEDKKLFGLRRLLEQVSEPTRPLPPSPSHGIVSTCGMICSQFQDKLISFCSKVLSQQGGVDSTTGQNCMI